MYKDANSYTYVNFHQWIHVPPLRSYHPTSPSWRCEGLHSEMIKDQLLELFPALLVPTPLLSIKLSQS